MAPRRYARKQPRRDGDSLGGPDAMLEALDAKLHAVRSVLIETLLWKCPITPDPERQAAGAKSGNKGLCLEKNSESSQIRPWHRAVC